MCAPTSPGAASAFRKGKAQIHAQAKGFNQMDLPHERKEYLEAIVEGIVQMLKDSGLEVEESTTVITPPLDAVEAVILFPGYELHIREHDWKKADFYQAMEDEETTQGN